MDKGNERLNAYWELLQTILSANPEEIEQILQANQDLIDHLFIQILEALGDRIEEKNTATFCGQLAKNLRRSMSENIAIRQPQYHRLIDLLLQCARGDTAKILKINRDLVDIGLIEAMGQRAGSLLVFGQTELANYLLELVQSIGQEIGIYQATNPEPKLGLGLQLKRMVGAISQHFSQPQPKTEPPSNQKSAPYFLLRLLQLVNEQNDQQFYQLIAQQPITKELAEELTTWAKQFIPSLTPAEQITVATDIGQLGQMCMSSRVGDPRANRTFAIDALHIALSYLNPTTQPQLWANLHNDLANCYGECQMVDKALSHYQSALQVYQLHSHPQKWGMLQNNMGLLYRETGQIEQAIICFQSALEGYTKQTNPQAWAITLINLGQTYEQRQHEFVENNLAKAINYYQQAEEIPQHRRTASQLKATAQTKYYNYQQQKQQGVMLGQQRMTAEQILQALAKYNLLSELKANLLIDRLIADITVSDIELAQSIAGFKQTFATTEQMQLWLSSRGMTEADIPEWSTRTIKLNQLKRQLFQHQIPSYFLQRKQDLDIVSYHQIRHTNRDLIQELYFRRQAGEATMEALAREYGQGDGWIASIELGQLPSILARLLSSAKVGDLLPPLHLETESVIIQLQQYIPAQLNEEMELRLLDELFNKWLLSQNL